MDLIEGAIEAYFQGVLEVVREEEGVRLLRMTREQLAYYDQNEGWAVRARCNAGVVLTLRTDSAFLDVEMDILPGARKYLGLDVEIDGVISQAVRLTEVEGTYRQRLFEASERHMREVRVYFAPNVEVRLRRVELEDGASVEVVEQPASRLLCLGDSITQGMDALSPCSTYPVQLSRLLGAELLNQGVGGHVFDVDSLDPELGFEPDLVTVAYGTNDWGRGIGPSGVQRAARAYLQKLREMFPVERTRIVVLSPIWRVVGHEEKGGVGLPEFGRMILETAKEIDGVETVDGLALVPNQPWYLQDGTHPNDLGFLHYGLNLYRLLRDQ
ncbi:MAG: SGNH/GDSL hydrolase family protein [bacterium]|nr:SGNH/GDSL hydrolase family protein [bacterium]